MIMDKTTEFADAENCFANASTILVGDQIDLGTGVKNVGRGQPLYLVVQVTTAAAGGTSINLQLASDAAASIATDGSATVHWQTGAVAVADFTVGRTWVVALPQGTDDYERYLGILAVNAGANSAGAINAFLTLDPQAWEAYPDAVN
jgi:hypothetical protein